MRGTRSRSHIVVVIKDMDRLMHFNVQGLKLSIILVFIVANVIFSLILAIIKHWAFLVGNCICGHLWSTDIVLNIAPQLITMSIELWASIFSGLTYMGILISHLWLLCAIPIVIEIIDFHLNMNLGIQMFMRLFLNVVVILLGLVRTKAWTLAQVRSRSLMLHLLLTLID